MDDMDAVLTPARSGRGRRDVPNDPAPVRWVDVAYWKKLATSVRRPHAVTE